MKELCDEGFCDQRTIAHVLEQRASKLFPENFLVGTGLESSMGSSEQLRMTASQRALNHAHTLPNSNDDMR